MPCQSFRFKEAVYLLKKVLLTILLIYDNSRDRPNALQIRAFPLVVAVLKDSGFCS